jgi:hypothetical protein
MAETRETARSGSTDTPSRALDLVGDSPELVAFGLLRSIVQLEQKQAAAKIDRAWLLDAYAECLAAVKGNRKSKAAGKK